MSKYFRINEITDWEEDTQMMDGDASHEGRREVQKLLEEERVKKIDNGEWKGMPFICEAENEIEALDQYNEKFCENDYIKAVEADCEEVHKIEVERQVDCLDYVVVFARDFDEAIDRATDIPVDNKKLSVIETHIVNGKDEVTGETKDLF